MAEQLSYYEVEYLPAGKKKTTYRTVRAKDLRAASDMVEDKIAGATVVSVTYRGRVTR